MSAGHAVGGRRNRPVRADARANIAAILDAATECLARDPDASIAAIAAAAGVGRVTLYGHFASRAELISAVAERAMGRATAALAAVDPEGESWDALDRLIDASWSLTRSHGAIVVAAEKTLPPSAITMLHVEPMRMARRVFERGQASGAFTTTLSGSWLATTLHAIIHAAANAMHGGEITADEGPQLIKETMSGILVRTS